MLDEDDYMSDKFLDGSEKSDIRPGLPKRKADERLHELYKKKLRTVQPKRAEQERDMREAGLSKAISGENKGFQMLAKMGYKPGTSLGKTNTGIIEPINVVVKTNNSGVGRGVVKKRKPAECHQDLEKLEGDFRKSLLEKKQNRQLRKYFAKAQTSCEYLDKMEDIEEPQEDFFWPKEVMDKLRNKCREVIEAEDEEDQVKEEDSEEDDYEDVITNENMSKMIEYLRLTYFYCIYCAAKGQDEKDLLSFCPGLTIDDHSLDWFYLFFKNETMNKVMSGLTRHRTGTTNFQCRGCPDTGPQRVNTPVALWYLTLCMHTRFDKIVAVTV